MSAKLHKRRFLNYNISFQVYNKVWQTKKNVLEVIFTKEVYKLRIKKNLRNQAYITYFRSILQILA